MFWLNLWAFMQVIGYALCTICVFIIVIILLMLSKED